MIPLRNGDDIIDTGNPYQLYFYNDWLNDSFWMIISYGFYKICRGYIKDLTNQRYIEWNQSHASDSLNS